MLRSIAGITESFTATWIFAGVRFLTGMRPEMSLEIFQSRVSFEATLKLYLRKHLINCINEDYCGRFYLKELRFLNIK